MRPRRTRRKTNYWPTVSLVSGILVAIAFYAWIPWPSPLGFLADLAGFGLALWGGLAVISQFVLPVQTMEERRRLFDHFMQYAGGAHGPIIYVKDGQLVGTQSELNMAGPGVALLDAASALVLERTYLAGWGFFRLGPARNAPPLVRAVGPGVAFIGAGERIVAALDLRPQTRSMAVQAHTRDGIEVGTTVSVTFSLLPPPASPAPTQSPTDAERNKPAFPFNPDSAFRAVYGGAITTGQQTVAWTQLPLDVAVEQLRNLLAEESLDGLFKPNIGQEYPFASFQGRVTAAVQAQPVLRERGIVVHRVGVGVPQMPRAVMNQRIRAWQTGWQKAILQQAAAGQSQAIKAEAQWHTKTQATLLKEWQAMMDDSTDPDQRKALALTLARLLQRNAAEPATRERLPGDTLRMLDSLPEWLGK